MFTYVNVQNNEVVMVLCCIARLVVRTHRQMETHLLCGLMLVNAFK